MKNSIAATPPVESTEPTTPKALDLFANGLDRGTRAAFGAIMASRPGRVKVRAHTRRPPKRRRKW